VVDGVNSIDYFSAVFVCFVDDSIESIVVAVLLVDMVLVSPEDWLAQ